MKRFAAGISLSSLALALMAVPGVARAQFVDPAEAATATSQNDATASVVAALLAQAKFWQANAQPAQSLDSIRRLLQLDPTNTDALALRVQIELADGDAVSASQDLATLKQLEPGGAELPLLTRMQAEAANPVDANAITAARNDAGAGDYAPAVTLYQQGFHGPTPPSGYGVEYYQTLAGTPGGYAEALSGLSDLVAQNPSDLQAQLAFATVETYQTAQRQSGISRLAVLTAFPAIAHGAEAAWKQALAYLPETPDSVPQYQAYLAKYPDDEAVQGLVLAATTGRPIDPADAEGNDRSNGFDALKADALANAAAQFQAALAINPNDSDALGGLGLVRMHQGETGAARRLLQEAIAANPADAPHWESALAGAERGDDYANANAMIGTGNLPGAERQLDSIIATGGDDTGAYEMLANVQSQRGELSSAAASWRTVLARDPDKDDALVGLGQILQSQGDTQGATNLFQQAQANGGGALVAGAQSAALRAQAAAATNPTVAMALYRAAVTAAPDDPWTRLDYARALQASGQDAVAREQMDGLTNGPDPSDADLQAGALFAAEDNRLADADALVARLPASAMTPDMQAIQARGALNQQVANAVAQGAGDPALTRQLLVTMAAAPDPDGGRGSAIATALVNAGDPQGAELAIQTAIAANPGAATPAMLNYAGAMLGAGQDAAAGQIVQTLQNRGGLTADQQKSLNAISDGLAIRGSDRLAAKGRLADAYDELAPGLAKTPEDPALNTALARLYTDDRQPKQALAINVALLANDPSNLDARDGAVSAAISAGDFTTAARLVQDGESAQPNEPRIWMMAANLAKAQGDTGTALDDLQTAQNLRQQQLIAQSGGSPAAALTAANATGGLSQVNPFADSADAGGDVTDAGPSVLGTQAGAYPTSPTPPDALGQQIATQIDALQASQMSYLQGGLGVESRSGSAGLDQLVTLTAPIIGSFSPHGVGNVSLSVTPTYLAAGEVGNSPFERSQFGADALGGQRDPGNQTAGGAAVNAAYSLPWLKANIGSTPLGFRTENIVGGVELDPSLPDGVGLALAFSRQAVTDSLLSYASVVDPLTGQVFGAVVRNRINAQVTLQAGAGYIYAGGAGDQLDGTHVRKNTEYEVGGGGGYPLYQTDNATGTAGLNLTYFSYSRNLRNFTLGQGGYFSPQSYFAGTVPVDYKETDGNLTWELGGTIGIQSYREDRTPYYPVDPGLQAQLVAAATTSTYLQAYYPGSDSTGVVGGANGKFEYRLNDQFLVGGRLDYQRTADWNDTQALLYARYLIGGPVR